ncbi:MAG TPA: hypothetical protein PKY05_13315, partial [Fibrobacteria bacterium]|nr:hypothetical protein [Fibrobacteria bacterium]
WASQSIPANLPALALGDTGSFSVAVRLRRTDSTQPMTALHWGDSSGNGIQIGWKGCDTFVLRVDRIPYRVTGFALSTDLEQVGLSWDGHRLAVLRGTDSVITLTTEALADRTGWRDPLFGTAGIAQVQWIAFHRGNTFQDWLRRLAKLSLATPSRGADSLNVP